MRKILLTSLLITAVIIAGCARPAPEETITETTTPKTTTPESTETQKAEVTISEEEVSQTAEITITDESGETTTAKDLTAFKFDHELFTIGLPASFNENEAENGVIRPKSGNDFSQIVYEVTDIQSGMTQDDLLDQEHARLDSLCRDTDACGGIGKSQQLFINGKEGIHFTIDYPGRSIDDPEGSLLEFHYSIMHGNKLIRFWTSATDKEKPEEVSKTFDEIINLITFK